MVLSTIRAMVIESFSERRRAGLQESFLVGAIIEAVDRVDDTTHVNVDGYGEGVGSGASASGSTASATTSKKEVLLCYVNNISEDVLKQKLLDLIPRQKIILTNVLKFPSSYRLSANSKVRIFCQVSCLCTSLRPYMSYYLLGRSSLYYTHSTYAIEVITLHN